MKRFLSLFLVLVLCLSMLPERVFAADETYDLWVGGIRVTSANASDVLGDGTVSYDNTINTLTLNGANITSGYSGGANSGINVNNVSGIKIAVTGASTISSYRAIRFANCDNAVLSLRSNLNITSSAAGLYADSCDMTVNGNGKLDIRSSYCIVGGNTSSCAIRGGVEVNLTGSISTFLGEGSGSGFSITIGPSATVTAYAEQYWMQNQAYNLTSAGTTTFTGNSRLQNVNVTGGTFIASTSSSTVIGSDRTLTVQDSINYRVYTGKDEDNATLQSKTTYQSDTNVKYIRVEGPAPSTYNVNVVAGENMSKVSGESSQAVTEDKEITDVVYTANSGYCFPETYSVEEVNGITVTRNSAKQITVSGTPTANANITLINASEHTPIAAVRENEIAATCENDGSYDEVVYCSVCGDEISRETKMIPALGHNYTAVVTQPDCTNKGYTTYTCSDCGDTYIGDYTDVLGHDFGDWIVITPATCTEEGVETRVCAHDASHTETRSIPALGHDFGKNEKVCKVCGTANSNYVEPTSEEETTTISPEDAKLPDVQVVEKEIKKTNTDKKDVDGSEYQLLKLKGTAKKQTIKLKWTKIKGADGYIIYGSKCGSPMEKITTINKASTKKYTFKKLKKNTYYKYMVVAYKKTAAGDKALTKSKSVHVATDGGKKGNPTKLTVKKKKITIKVKKKIKVQAKMTSKKKVNTHIAKFRYESANPKIAKVNKKGKIKGLKKGKTSVYVYAQNGLCKKIKVTVK